jgi:hypothetical protein
MHYALEDVSTFEDFIQVIRSSTPFYDAIHRKNSQSVCCTNPFTGVEHTIQLCTYSDKAYYWVLNGNVSLNSGKAFYSKWMKLCLTP